MEHGGPVLAKIHRKANEAKVNSHFTGFVEGIVASGYFEAGEVEPLITECQQFLETYLDEDAFDIIEDFHCDILERETLEDVVEYRARTIDPACGKSAINRFLGFCRGVACDGDITTKEAASVLGILEANSELRAVTGVRQIEISCRDALEDGIVDDLESQEICDAIGAIVGDCFGDTGLAQTFGVANYEEVKFPDLSEIEGQVVVLTGTFKMTPRKIFEEQLSAHGATIVRHVSGNTSLVIVGGEASRDWIELNRGTKIRKAQQLRNENGRPDFISEAQILRLMGD